ncbi:hypothetical protein DNL40_04675 [Xylanimonas oleitrophica]|uniref:Uncharacterized protein n=1 Tax=Xylanimonas oleitrophica TaxID=2607479 RepID=A0A2W5WRT2_9MICO|nr:hypothetical protein [Xylanimonas oleitrophica]PZR54219.1 hypothetical protein DNL40_04675 [Xylanimonas oleitrophica]
MSALTGTWDVRMKTPVGTVEAVYTFTEDLTGTAATAAEAVPLEGIALARSAAPGDAPDDGVHATWHQSVTRPMRLHLRFDVVVTGDTLAGTSRAGRLPRTAVTGTRRPA